MNVLWSYQLYVSNYLIPPLHSVKGQLQLRYDIITVNDSSSHFCC